MELLLLLLLYEGFGSGYDDYDSCTSCRHEVDRMGERRVSSDFESKHFNDPFETMAMPPAWTKADVAASDTECDCTER